MLAASYLVHHSAGFTGLVSPQMGSYEILEPIQPACPAGRVISFVPPFMTPARFAAMVKATSSI